MLLGGDGVFLRRADQLEALHADFVAARQAGRALVAAHLAADADGGLLRQAAREGEFLLVHFVAEGDALHDAAAVAQADEVQATLAGARLHPALQQHLLALVRGDVGDADEGWLRQGPCSWVRRSG